MLMTVEIILPKASDTRYFLCLYSCFYISHISIYIYIYIIAAPQKLKFCPIMPTFSLVVTIY